MKDPSLKINIHQNSKLKIGYKDHLLNIYLEE